jgi:hypothetical protein
MKRLLLLALLLAAPFAFTQGTVSHIRSGASLPGACNPSTGDVFFKTGTGVGLYPCVASNTWGTLTAGKTRAISFTIGDPGGSALSAASTTTDYVTVPFGCTISAYNLVVDAGTITVKFWKVATGTAIPTSANSISTSGVGISSGTAIHSATVTDFTSTAVSANDIIAMSVTAVATAKYVNGVLECDQ